MIRWMDFDRFVLLRVLAELHSPRVAVNSESSHNGGLLAALIFSSTVAC